MKGKGRKGSKMVNISESHCLSAAKLSTTTASPVSGIIMHDHYNYIDIMAHAWITLIRITCQDIFQFPKVWVSRDHMIYVSHALYSLVHSLPLPLPFWLSLFFDKINILIYDWVAQCIYKYPLFLYHVGGGVWGFTPSTCFSLASFV